MFCSILSACALLIRCQNGSHVPRAINKRVSTHASANSKLWMNAWALPLSPGRFGLLHHCRFHHAKQGPGQILRHIADARPESDGPDDNRTGHVLLAINADVAELYVGPYQRLLDDPAKCARAARRRREGRPAARRRKAHRGIRRAPSWRHKGPVGAHQAVDLGEGRSTLADIHTGRAKEERPRDRDANLVSAPATLWPRASLATLFSTTTGLEKSHLSSAGRQPAPWHISSMSGYHCMSSIFPRELGLSRPCREDSRSKTRPGVSGPGGGETADARLSVSLSLSELRAGDARQDGL